LERGRGAGPAGHLHGLDRRLSELFPAQDDSERPAGADTGAGRGRAGTDHDRDNTRAIPSREHGEESPARRGSLALCGARDDQARGVPMTLQLLIEPGWVNAVLPEIVLSIGGLVLILFSAFFPRLRNSTAPLALI